MAEESEIQFGLTRIPFQIRRSMRRGTVALTIEHDGGLVVTAPNDVSIDKLNAVVRDKAFWVIQHSREVRALGPRPGPREFVSGETVLYLGRQYRLKVVDAGDNVGPRMWAGWYEIPVEGRRKGEERQHEVRRRLIASLREHAELYLPDRLTEVCARARIEKTASPRRRAAQALGELRRTGHVADQLADHPGADSADRVRLGARTRAPGASIPRTGLLGRAGSDNAGLRGAAEAAAGIGASFGVVEGTL